MDIFRSDRLLYRAAEDNPADQTFLQALYSDPEIVFMASHMLQRPFSTAATKDLIKELEKDKFLSVLICKIPKPGSSSDSEPQPIGTMALKGEKEHFIQDRSYECGIVLAREHQGKGYGGEALSWLVGWAFDIAGAHRVELSVYEWNERARKVYEKMGFVHEGRRRKALWKNGRWWDDIRMAVLEDEWKRA